MGPAVHSVVWLLLCLIVSPSEVTAKVPADHMNRQSRSSELGVFLQLGEATGPLKTVRQWGSAVLECEFQGSPPPTVEWLRDKPAIHSQDRPSEKITELRGELSSSLQSLLLDTPTSIVASRSRLYLECLTPADQGEYTCQGRTSRDVASSTTQLYVTEPRLSEESITACEEAKGAPFKPARIVQWRPKLLAMMGGQVRLVCITTGLPAPSVSWTKNYQPLDTVSGRITVMPSGDLIIDDLQWSDMGQYQCTASNDFSSDSVNSFLYPFRASE